MCSSHSVCNLSGCLAEIQAQEACQGLRHRVQVSASQLRGVVAAFSKSLLMPFLASSARLPGGCANFRRCASLCRKPGVLLVCPRLWPPAPQPAHKSKSDMGRDSGAHKGTGGSQRSSGGGGSTGPKSSQHDSSSSSDVRALPPLRLCAKDLPLPAECCLLSCAFAGRRRRSLFRF